MSVTRRGFLQGAVAAAALGAGGRLLAQGPRRPNIVFILADDLGWMDTTPYGSQYYETPSLARLAASSLRFTNAYAANPLCSPTRASILTGKYPARLGLTTPAGHLPPPDPEPPLLPAVAPAHQRVILPGTRRYLPLEEHTLAEALAEAGYATGHFGKWHLGLRPEHWPDRQGYQTSFHGAPDPGPRSYFSPYRFPVGTVTDGPAGEYITDRLTDEAIAWLRQRGEQPFFLALWHYAVHAPYHAKQPDIEHFERRTDPRGEQANPVMGGMIKSLDEGIGRVLDELDRLGLTDNTLIVFFSDNGGNEYDRVAPYGLAPTENAPLRSGKGSAYEGGMRVPMMVSWPGQVAPGTTSDEVVMSIDFYPTLLAAAGVSPQPDQVIDGVDLLPLWTGQASRLEREAVFGYMPHWVQPPTGLLNRPCCWVRRGDWKLFRFFDPTPEYPQIHELYNLAADPGETTDRSAEQPALVAELDALISGFLAEVAIAPPRPNPNHNPLARDSVGGWRASGQCSLAVVEGQLQITSTGGDPFIQTSDVPEASGELAVVMRLRSNSAGGGQLFWTDTARPRFGPQARLDFTPRHDGHWHEYRVPFEATGRLGSLRIDPSTAPGELALAWVRLETADGRVLKQWEFGE